jgi:hypothetical protein
MSEKKTITLPKTMPLADRIEGVSQQISKWLASLDEPFNAEQDVLHLVRCDRNGHYRYVYVLERAVRELKKASTQGDTGESS